MELPTLITNQLFFLVVMFLAIIPFFALYATVRIGQIYFKDSVRPRNRVLKAILTTCGVIGLAGLFVTALCVSYAISYFKGEAPDADFGGLAFAGVLSALEIQPYLLWRALNSINGNVDQLEETQNQREDRFMGDHRRDIERRHRLDN